MDILVLVFSFQNTGNFVLPMPVRMFIGDFFILSIDASV